MSVPGIPSLFNHFLVQQRAERENGQISTVVNEVLNDLLYIIQCRHTDSTFEAVAGLTAYCKIRILQ